MQKTFKIFHSVSGFNISQCDKALVEQLRPQPHQISSTLPTAATPPMLQILMGFKLDVLSIKVCIYITTYLECQKLDT